MSFFPGTDLTSSGTITTQNLVPAGTATANSAVAAPTLDGRGTVTFQVTGTYTGALSPQVTIDGTNWVTITANILVDQSTNALVAQVPSANVGVYQVDVSGFNGFRITGLAAITGTATVTIRASYAQGIISLDQTQNQDLFITGQSAQTALVSNILTTTAGSASIDCVSQTSNLSYRSFAIQITSTGTAGAYTFEGSNDNTNFVVASCINVTTITGTTVTGNITPTSSTIIYHGPINFRYLRCRIATAVTGGSIQAFTKLSLTPYQPFAIQATQSTGTSLVISSSSLVPGTTATSLGKAEDAAFANADTLVGMAIGRQDTITNNTSASGDYQLPIGNKYGALYTQNYKESAKTFSASIDITLAALATDVAVLPGNASNTVYLTKIILSGFATTASSNFVSVIRRSTANSGGTSSNMGVIAHDSADAGVSVPIAYTANGTPGSTVGNIRTIWLPFGSTTVVCDPVIFDFSEKGKPLTLAGVAQSIVINLGGGTVTGGHLSITFEWVEA